MCAVVIYDMYFRTDGVFFLKESIYSEQFSNKIKLISNLLKMYVEIPKYYIVYRMMYLFLKLALSCLWEVQQEIVLLRLNHK